MNPKPLWSLKNFTVPLPLLAKSAPYVCQWGLFATDWGRGLGPPQSGHPPVRQWDHPAVQHRDGDNLACATSPERRRNILLHAEGVVVKDVRIKRTRHKPAEMDWPQRPPAIILPRCAPNNLPLTMISIPPKSRALLGNLKAPAYPPAIRPHHVPDAQETDVRMSKPRHCFTSFSGGTASPGSRTSAPCSVNSQQEAPASSVGHRHCIAGPWAVGTMTGAGGKRRQNLWRNSIAPSARLAGIEYLQEPQVPGALLIRSPSLRPACRSGMRATP